MEEPEARPVLRRYRSWAEAVPSLLGWLLVATVVAVGIYLHLRYLYGRPLSSDEAVPGLIATQMLHGHFVAFYWGQYYGGTVEPLVIAAAMAVFGHDPTVVMAVPVVLAGVAAALTWRIAARLTTSSWLAAFAGALTLVAPQAAVSGSSYEWGFRGATMALGLLAVLMAMRLEGARFPLVESALLGVVLGLGWWSSPEIVYLALPAVVIGLLALRKRWVGESGLRAASYAGAAVLGAVAGALPWIWANVGSHLKSLSEKYIGLPAHSPGYFGHLRIFFQYSVGLLFSLRAPSGWQGGRPLALAILSFMLLLLAGAVVLCFRRGGAAAVLAASVIAFPFLLAVSPSVWFWGDGRYVGYVVPLVVVVLVAGWAGSGAWTPRWRWPGAFRWPGTGRIGTATVLAAGGLMAGTSLVEFHGGRSLHSGNPNGMAEKAAAALEANAIRYGYADYWVAYDLDFLGRGRLVIAPSPHDRHPATTRQVAAARSAAWLFVRPEDMHYFQGETYSGPDNMTEQDFEAYLTARRIPYRVVGAGAIRAVVPAQNVAAKGL